MPWAEHMVTPTLALSHLMQKKTGFTLVAVSCIEFRGVAKFPPLPKYQL